MLRKKEIDIQYIVVAPFDRVTLDAIHDDLVTRLKDRLHEGYTIASATGSLDGSIHYVLVKRSGSFWQRFRPVPS